MRLKDKSAIITGSTRGIGLTIAERLASEGATIVISGTRQEKVDAVAAEISSKYNTTVHGIACDVSSLEDCENFIKKSLELCPKIDILVNNAGITRDNLLLRMKADEWNDVIQTNLNSVFYLTKNLTRHMLKNKYGKIINIASIVGVMGNAGQANYCAAKAGVIGFTKTVARELGTKGIFCNAVAPGFIETDMINALPEEHVNNIIQSIPIKRLGSTDDISNLVLFLASDESNYITGQVIAIDGGLNI